MSPASRDPKACPICGKPQDTRLKPFCSRRCADVDLGKWLKGGYAIPAREAPEGEDEAESKDEGSSSLH